MNPHRMIVCLTASFCMCLSIIAQTAPNQEKVETGSSKELKPGVVVEIVTKDSAGEKAGLREGDVILRWSHGDSKGEIESPFDLERMRIESVPLGEVIVSGLRDGRNRNWTLSQGNWGSLATRPNFSGFVFSNYERARAFTQAGNSAEAAQAWNETANGIVREESSIVWLWLKFRAAESFAAANQWREGDAAYENVTQQGFARGEPTITAQLLRAWAFTYKKRNDWTNAEKYYQQALREARKVNSESLLVALVLNDLGSVADQRGDLDKAEEYYRQALTIRAGLAPESLDFAATLNNLGVVAWRRGDLTQAEAYYNRALRIRQTLAPGSLDLAASFVDLGIVAAQRGDLAKADKYCRESLEIREKLSPGSIDVAMALVNLGSVVQYRGDFIQAEEYYRRALAIEQSSAPAGLYYVPGTLGGLSLIAQARGDLVEADEYLQQALALQEKLSPDSLAVALQLSNLGELELERGNLVQAEEYLKQALEIRKKFAPDSVDIAETLNILGTVALQGGNLVQAEEYCQQALAIIRKLSPEGPDAADILINLGDVVLQRGNLGNAERYYRQALAIRQVLTPGSTNHAEALAVVAGIMLRKQQLDVAAQLFEQALNALESQTARLGGAEEVRAVFRAKHARYYRDYIDLLVAQKRPVRAFEVLERSRARTLLEMLSAAHVDIRKGVDAALLQRERSLQSDIAAKSNLHLRLLGDKQTEQQAAAVSKEIEGLLTQHKDVEEQIRVSSPSYAALTQPQPLTAKEIQEQVLDNDTILLEYSLGEDRSYLFALTSSSLNGYELPKRAEIESKTRSLYDLLTERDRPIPGESARARQARISKAEAEYRDGASVLSRILLGPVAALLAQKRLLIVSDGALHYVPFAALPVPATSGQDSSTPLMVDHEIVNLPSASTLAVLRREQADRKQPTKQVVVLADPVFDKQDARVRSTAGPNGSKGKQRSKDENEAGLSNVLSMRQLTRSAADLELAPTGELHLPRLPFTRDEAKTILAVVPPGASKEALDFDASRKLAVSGELAKYHVVHFATHALVDNVHPELSGLVLSLVDQQGAPQDGFLDLQDIYNLDLPADLVVLSACQTGLGKEINGEGMIGLTRGFMYAGASSVVSTLWKVDDFATAKLMGHFYRAMKRGRMTPAQALRQAQLALWKEDRWSAPYYWAGFTLQGEWK